MTQNQIAARSEREAERHNAAFEAETERHNKELESISQEANDIQAWYNSRTTELTEWYNKAYIEYLNASEQDKVALESELNSIKAMQAEADARYKDEMARISAYSAERDAAYKQAMAKIGAYNAEIAAKQAYYEGQKTEAYAENLRVQNELAKKKYELDVKQADRSYELGLISAAQRDQQIEQAKKDYELATRKQGFTESQWNEVLKEQETARTKNIEMDTIKKGTGAASDIVGSGLNLGLKLFGF